MSSIDQSSTTVAPPTTRRSPARALFTGLRAPTAGTRVARVLLLAIVPLAVVTPLVRGMDSEQPGALAVKLVLGTLFAAVVPGVLITTIVGPLRRVSVLEVAGLGCAISLAVSELLTVISLSLHLSVTQVGNATVLGCALLAAIASVRVNSGMRVVLPVGELGLAALLVPVAVLLYAQGAPYTTIEDEIHLAVIRRLSVIAQPSLTNFYYTPGAVYTYPFPGTHYLIALVSSVGGLDPLFAYVKLRFFWGPLALVFVYLAARLLLGSRTAALVTGLAATLFVLNGAFAAVPGFYWGQLAPYSHASDIAMNIVLPGLIVLALYFLTVPSRRGSLFFFICAATIIFQLAVVHIRELAQFAVYSGCWILATTLVRFRHKWRYLARAGLLLVTSIAIVGIYTVWYRLTVGHIDVVVDQHRAQLETLARSMSPADFFLSPFLDNRFSVAYEYFAYGWNPIALVAGPILLVLFPRRIGVALLSMCVLMYLLIVRFPALAIPYVYFTYFEILFTPVRNVIFFLYVIVGATVFASAVLISRLEPRLLRVATATCVSVAVGLIWRWLQAAFPFGGPTSVGLDVLIVGTSLLYVAAFLVYRRRSVIRAAAKVLPRAQHGPSPAVVAALLVPLTALTTVPVSMPGGLVAGVPGTLSLAAVSAGLAVTPRSLVANLVCPLPPAALTPASADYITCQPDQQVVAWARDKLPMQSVLASNALNMTVLTAFMPQQFVSPPAPAIQEPLLRAVFPDYYDLFDGSASLGRVQPFFNQQDNPDERRAFVQRLGVTHILLSPAEYAWMKPILDSQPEIYGSLYDDQQWAVYQVHRG